MRKKNLQHAMGLRMEDARDALVESSVESKENPEVKPMLNRPPLKMLGDTLVIAKQFPVATRGHRTHCGTQSGTQSKAHA